MDPFMKYLLYRDYPRTIRDLREWANCKRERGDWEYIWHRPAGSFTAMEAAEAFACFIGWAPEEILALSENELWGAISILEESPVELSPYKMHLRYEEADAISDAVGALVREHDARTLRTRERQRR